MSTISLSRGLVALVDEADCGWLSQWKWSAQRATTRRGWYAARTGNLLMHRLILGVTQGEYVDHVNGDGLDNRRANLRVATYSQNSVNRPARGRTGYRGVHQQRGKFVAAAEKDGRRQYIGIYATAEAAARAYDAVAVDLHAEFARPNFPEEWELIEARANSATQAALRRQAEQRGVSPAVAARQIVQEWLTEHDPNYKETVA